MPHTGRVQASCSSMILGTALLRSPIVLERCQLLITPKDILVWSTREPLGVGVLLSLGWESLQSSPKGFPVP